MKTLHDVQKDLRRLLEKPRKTMEDIDQISFDLTVIIKCIGNSKKSENTKRKRVLLIIAESLPLLIQVAKEIATKKQTFSKEYQAQTAVITKYLLDWKKIFDSLPKDTLNQLDCLASQVCEKLLRLDRKLQLQPSFNISLKAYSECRGDVNTLFVKMIELPLAEHTHLIKNIISFHLNEVFDVDIRTLTLWKKHEQMNALLYHVCSTHELIPGNERH